MLMGANAIESQHSIDEENNMKIPQQMKAILWTGFGGHDKLEYREDVPTPKPGRDEVLIHVGACGCNNTDIWNREGAYGKTDDPDAESGWLREQGGFKFPRIQGADIAGEIVAVGENVPTSRVGERVMVNLTLYGWAGRGEGLFDAGYVGSEIDGGFAEYAVMPASNVLEITDSTLSDIDIAAMGPASSLTAYHLLNRGRLTAGETVVITGASGGVGTGAIQLARIMGAYVIAVASGEKAEILRDLGAHVVVDRKTETLADDILKAAEDRPIDLVADVVAGPQLSSLFEVVRPGGRVATSGSIAGPVVEFDVRTIYLKHLDFVGATLGTPDEFARLVQFINEGRFKPVVGGVYDLKDLPTAQNDFKSKKFVGNLVVTPRS